MLVTTETTVATRTVLEGEVDAIVHAYHTTPFDVLGPHLKILDNGRTAVAIRAFRPFDRQVFVVDERDPSRQTPMSKVHPAGLFEAVFEGEESLFPYRLHVVDDDDAEADLHDPYAFPLLLTDFDLHLMVQGRHYRTYDRLGAHVREVAGVPGVHFAMWAPNALRVSVIGNFNHWDGRTCPMQMRPEAGVWELFLPDLEPGEVYKYEIKSRFGNTLVEKADPYAFYAERRPRTASVVFDIEEYLWNDQAWMEKRQAHNALDAPISVYEVHLGSWKRAPESNGFLNYRELADQLAEYVQCMGYTHIELLPICEYPFDGSWGYQTLGYFAPTSRFGTPADFMAFVDTLHRYGIGVLLDWVPGHFPRDQHGLAFFDGTYLYEHADPRLGEHVHWGTKIFNYGRTEVRNFLLSNALFWLEKYHIDGLRVDAVASMLYLDYGRQEGEWAPNIYGGRENLEAVDFLKSFNELVHREHPDVLTIAEESTAWPQVSRPTGTGGLGFDLKWNMGWMHDMLEYMQHDPLYRRYHQNTITFSMLYAFHENFILPFSHDEVVHLKRSMLSKMPGDDWQKFAHLRALYAYMFGHPGKKLLFMGGEFGQWNEWDFAHSLDWHLLQWDRHQQLQRFVSDLNHIYRSQPALHQVDFTWEGFQWIDFQDMDHSVVSFVRRAKNHDDLVVVISNFTPVPHEGYRVGVPRSGFYQELLNSDSARYGGSNAGNERGIPSEPIPMHGFEHSVSLRLPPLGVLFLKPQP